jgi:uncharacterized protein YndB with AHSA1/START domain
MSGVRFEVEEHIEAPIGQVFDRLTDLDRYGDWMPAGGAYRGTVKLTAGPVGAGTTYVDRSRLGAAEGEVTEVRRPTRVVFRQRVLWWGRRVMDGRIVYELRPVPGGTLVHQIAEPRLYGVGRLLAPLVSRLGPGERARVLAGLKWSLERRAPVCPWPDAGDAPRRAA